METAIAIIALLCGVVGIIGSILPGLPGPPVSWVGMLLLYFWGGTNGDGDTMSLTLLLIWLIVTIIITILDYWVPLKFTQLTGGSKYAGRGALIGMLAGIILTPIGMLLGSFLGALIAEMLYAKKPLADSLTAALGSFLGFLAGTGMKLIIAVWMLCYIIVYMC